MVRLVCSYRERVQQDGDEENHYDEDDESYEEAPEPSPHNELHGLTWVGEPKEGRFWASNGYQKE